MSENTDTPITDKCRQQIAQLERQLDEARQQHDAVLLGARLIDRDLQAMTKQRDMLAKACQMLMRIIGSKDDPAWADDDQIDAAYNTGEQALAALNQPGERTSKPPRANTVTKSMSSSNPQETLTTGKPASPHASEPLSTTKPSEASDKQ